MDDVSHGRRGVDGTSRRDGEEQRVIVVLVLLQQPTIAWSNGQERRGEFRTRY